MTRYIYVIVIALNKIVNLHVFFLFTGIPKSKRPCLKRQLLPACTQAYAPLAPAPCVPQAFVAPYPLVPAAAAHPFFPAHIAAPLGVVPVAHGYVPAAQGVLPFVQPPPCGYAPPVGPVPYI